MRPDRTSILDGEQADGPVPRDGNHVPRRWRSMWISDPHLGASACRAELLLGLLRHFGSDHLYLVGDVVAGARFWDLQRWDPAQGEVVRALVERAAGSEVVYVTGRDDGFVRRHAGRALGGVHLREETVHATADGRSLLVRPFAEAVAARKAALFERGLDLVRTAVAQRVVRRAASHDGSASEDEVERRELALVGEARRRGLDGVVCGHPRHAGIRRVDGMLLCNAGEWIGSRSVLVEDARGKLALLRLSALGASCAAAGVG